MASPFLGESDSPTPRPPHPEPGGGPVGVELVELSVDRAFDELEQIALQSQQDRLCLGIAEAAVEFERARIAGHVDHQASVEKSAVAITFVAIPLSTGWMISRTTRACS